jgi:hypothetical protein
VLWTVHRSGHVNLNSARRLKALPAVIDWSETGTAPYPMDAALIMDTIPVAAIHTNTAAGRITRTRALYGNIYTSFVPGDLRSLGITLRDTFNLTHGKQTVSATLLRPTAVFPSSNGSRSLIRKAASKSRVITPTPLRL